MDFSGTEAMMRITNILRQQNLNIYKAKTHHDAYGNMVYAIGSGIRLSAHKNTWKRKQETSHLIRVEYFLNGQKLLHHVEPWVVYPSDYLIARLMLLPPEEVEKKST